MNIHGDGYSNKGFPDILIFGNNKAIAVELKSDSGYKLQADQMLWRKRLTKVGTPHYVVENNDIDRFKEIIFKEFENETK